MSFSRVKLSQRFSFSLQQKKKKEKKVTLIFQKFYFSEKAVIFPFKFLQSHSTHLLQVPNIVADKTKMVSHGIKIIIIYGSADI